MEYVCGLLGFWKSSCLNNRTDTHIDTGKVSIFYDWRSHMYKKISREVYRFSGDLQLSARTGREDSEIHQSRNRYKSLTSCIIHFPSISPIGFKTIFSPTKCYHFCVSSINIIWIRSVFCLGGEVEFHQISS